MASVNKVTILGNLGKDPEVRQTAGGTDVCKLNVATSRRWKDKDGNKQEKTEWHNIVVYGATAKPCGQYLAKGRQVYVEGRIETRQYEKDGVTKYITEIIADDVQFLGGGDRQAAPAQTQGEEPTVPPVDDDIPF